MSEMENKERKITRVDWKVYTPGLLQEILDNPGTGILRIPLQLMQNILQEVAQRATELHDGVMDALMMRLSLYAVADGYSKEYDAKLVREYMEKELGKEDPHASKKDLTSPVSYGGSV